MRSQEDVLCEVRGAVAIARTSQAPARDPLVVPGEQLVDEHRAIRSRPPRRGEQFLVGEIRVGHPSDYIDRNARPSFVSEQ